MTVPDNNLPTFAETDLTGLWRYRQEFKEEEDHGKTHRRHAEQELFKRAAEADATILQTEHGPIEISYPDTYSYNRAVVDKEFYALIERDGLTEEWNQFVSHAYKIDKRWLSRLLKRGKESGYREVIEKMTIGGRGSPSLKGPELKDMGGYAPRGEGEDTLI